MRTVPSSEQVTNFVSTGQKLKVRKKLIKKIVSLQIILKQIKGKQNILNEQSISKINNFETYISLKVFLEIG